MGERFQAKRLRCRKNDNKRAIILCLFLSWNHLVSSSAFAVPCMKKTWLTILSLSSDSIKKSWTHHDIVPLSGSKRFPALSQHLQLTLVVLSTFQKAIWWDRAVHGFNNLTVDNVSEFTGQWSLLFTLHTGTWNRQRRSSDTTWTFRLFPSRRYCCLTVTDGGKPGSKRTYCITFWTKFGPNFYASHHHFKGARSRSLLSFKKAKIFFASNEFSK